jgi:glyoxylase-like metal-dependent hydrolase (beta-lactamase superfamily II)
VKIADFIYSTHILEDQRTFGAMHPGGTQIYFIGDPQEEMVIIDSGEPYRSWSQQILAYHTELGRPRISAILITHGHGDHIGGLDRLQDELGCPVRCHPKLEPYLTERLGRGCVEGLKSREVVPVGGKVRLRALFSPGHAEDHVTYAWAGARTIFSGDTILGNSSSSVQNLKQYMSSLELLARQRPDTICPGHGQVIHDGARRINWYIEHRRQREEQIVEALAAGAATVEQIVTAVYPRNLRKNLRSAAARNVRTHLSKLVEEGRVAEIETVYAPEGKLAPG